MVSEWELIDFFKQNKGIWFTAKEIILHLKEEITPTTIVVFNRKLRQLVKHHEIGSRICARNIAWKREFEYTKTKNKKRIQCL